MSNQRRPVLRVVFWIVFVGVVTAGFTLAALDRLLLASALLIGSVVPLAVIGWFAGYMSGGSGRFDPERAWKTSRIMLIFAAPVTLAGVVLFLVGPGTLGGVLLKSGIGLALAVPLIRYTIRMDHPEAPDFTGAEVALHASSTRDGQAD